MPAEILITIKGQDQATSVINNVSVSMTKLGADAEKSGGGFSTFGEIAKGALRQVGALVVDVAAKGASALAGFAADSIKVAGDFEQGFNAFRVAAGQSIDPKGMQQFRQLFIDLGKELPVSTSEVEQAATEMVTGGIDPAIVAAGGLRSTIQFAAAAQLSLGDAAETSAKLLAGWADASASAADKATFLSNATDTLTKAAAASSTTVSELRLGIFNTQGSAQLLHVPLEQVATTLAELAPAFHTSAEAGTAMNVFLSRLEPQTQKASDAMRELGIITKDGQNLFFDAKGNFLGMANAAQVLQDHLAKLSPEQQVSYMHTLFGNDAQKIGNALMQQGADGYNTMAAAMAKQNGVAAAAGIMQSGYNTALENAKGSVEALQITIGSALLPVLTNLLNNVIAPGVNTITTLASAVTGDRAAFASLSPQLQQVATVISTVIIPAVQQAAAWIGANLPGAAEKAGTVFMTQVLPALQSAAAFITGTVIPDLIILVSWLQTNVPPAAAAVASVFTTQVLPAFQAVSAFVTGTVIPDIMLLVSWLQTNIPPAAAAVTNVFNTQILPAYQAVSAFMSGTLIPLLQALGNLFNAVISPYVEQAKQQFSALGGALSSNATPAMTALKAILDASTAPIRAVIGAANAAAGAFGGWKAIIDSLIAKINALASAIRSLPSIPGATGNLAVSAGAAAARAAGIGGRALGGPVYAGGAYLVGEHGPELFVPGQGGRIVPNHVTNNYNYNPTYGAVPPSPAHDFATMKTLAGVA